MTVVAAPTMPLNCRLVVVVSLGVLLAGATLVVGAGAAKRLSAVRWGVAGNIAFAWALTLPAAGVVGAAAYAVANVFGGGALGPLLITVIIVGALAALIVSRRERAAETAQA